MKCSRKRKKFCETLLACVDKDGQYGSGRRLFISSQVINMKTGEKLPPAVAYQWGKKHADWAWIKYCPFCGGDVMSHKNRQNKLEPNVVPRCGK
jgi:hypothetical protein